MTRRYSDDRRRGSATHTAFPDDFEQTWHAVDFRQDDFSAYESAPVQPHTPAVSRTVPTTAFVLLATGLALGIAVMIDQQDQAVSPATLVTTSSLPAVPVVPPAIPLPQVPPSLVTVQEVLQREVRPAGMGPSTLQPQADIGTQPNAIATHVEREIEIELPPLRPLELPPPLVTGSVAPSTLDVPAPSDSPLSVESEARVAPDTRIPTSDPESDVSTPAPGIAPRAAETASHAGQVAAPGKAGAARVLARKRAAHVPVKRGRETSAPASKAKGEPKGAIEPDRARSVFFEHGG